MARICLGEFDWPDNRGKREYVQLVFLQALETLDEAPLKQLYDMPFLLYRMATEQLHLNYLSITQPWRLSGVAASVVETLESEIDAWVKRWNLNADWCKDVAFATLHAWSCASPELPKLFFQHAGGGGFIPASPDPPTGFPKYHPYCGWRDHYLEFVRSKVLKAIGDNPLLNQAPRPGRKAFADSIVAKAEEYCRSVEDIYDRAGWIRCRSNEKMNLKQQLDWTVRFQVSGKTSSEVAEEANVEQTTVSRAVREILSILPLPPRSDSGPGRIRGTKNKRRVESGIRRSLGRQQ